MKVILIGKNKFWKKISLWSTKKWKTDAWNLDLGEKMATNKNKKNVFAPEKVKNFLITSNRVKLEKKVVDLRKKWKTNILSFGLGDKIKKSYFQKHVCARHRM